MKKKIIKFRDPSILVFSAFLIVTCIVYWSIALFNNVRGVNLKNFANNRNTYSTILYAKRGAIYDCNNNVLALNVSSYTVIAYLSSSRTTDIEDPQHVVDKEKTAELLSPLLNMSYSYILSLLNTKDVYQVELGPGGRGISTLLKEQIEALNLPGIDFDESSKRFYPNGNFASYIVGYAKNNEKIEYKLKGLFNGLAGDSINILESKIDSFIENKLTIVTDQIGKVFSSEYVKLIVNSDTFNSILPDNIKEVFINITKDENAKNGIYDLLLRLNIGNNNSLLLLYNFK